MPRRVAATAVLLLALNALLATGGCAGTEPGRVADSHVSYDRTYDIALAAMADQRLTFSVQDRRQGRIVGTAGGVTLVATIEPLVDGAVRVVFLPQGASPADAALAVRAAESYNARMAKLGLLGGFKDADEGSHKGPTPCPSGPALCP